METSKNKSGQQGIFINGKAQMIQLLQALPPEEKKTLIKNMQLRNPQLTGDLQRSSFTFDSLDGFEDYQLRTYITGAHPKILGLALRGSRSEFQRRVLKLLPSEKAEAAYETMTAPLENSRELSQKAQKKILSEIQG